MAGLFRFMGARNVRITATRALGAVSRKGQAATVISDLLV